MLAGGLGRRMGAVSKPGVELGGWPMVAWPVAALAQVCDRVAVVAKASTELPPLDAERWDEPAEPQHPLTGLVFALERAERPVLVCAADMPYVEAPALRVVRDGLGRGVACVGRAGGRVQPLLAAYAPEALSLLRAAPDDAPLTRTVQGLDPVVVDVPGRDAISIDTPEALRAARLSWPSPAAG